MLTMECMTFSCSAAFCSPSQMSLVSSVRGCSSSATCSSFQLRSQDSQTSGRCLYRRNSSLFRSFSTSLDLSSTLSFCSSPVVVCSSTSPLQTENVPSLNLKDEARHVENLSAKERRKLRNERRQEAKASEEHPWKEMVEEKLLAKKKKIRGWEEDGDINRCISKGVQWWMIQTAKKQELQVAEQISIIFPENFPGREFEVLVPTVPVRKKLKDGSVSLSRKNLYQGIVLLRCLLDRDVHFMVKCIPRTYEFFGNLAGLSIQPVVMPAPVSTFNMDNLLGKIRKEEEEFQIFKEQCRKEVEEQQREEQRRDEEKQRKDEEQRGRDLNQKHLRSRGLTLEVGATVRVLSGPFLEFTGIVIELLPKVNKIKALVTVFGNNTPVVLDVKDVVVEAAAAVNR